MGSIFAGEVDPVQAGVFLIALRMKRETDEECEDADGNVYNKKTYEDLRRQGLI